MGPYFEFIPDASTATDELPCCLQLRSIYGPKVVPQTKVQSFPGQHKIVPPERPISMASSA